MEYLYFDHQEHDSLMEEFRQDEQQHFREWCKLVRANVLRPSDDQESLGNYEMMRQAGDEVVAAQQAVEAAQSKLNSVDSTIRARSADLSEQRPAQVEQDHLAAQTQLAVATAALEQADRRNELIALFERQNNNCLEGAEKNLKRHRMLLRWTL